MLKRLFFALSVVFQGLGSVNLHSNEVSYGALDLFCFQILRIRPFFFIWPTMKKAAFFMVNLTMKFMVKLTMKNEDFDEFTSASFSEKGL